MHSILLNGVWRLARFEAGKCALSHPDQLDSLAVDCLEAEVPGNVELDLQRAGRLPDPFFGTNIHALRPLEFHEWWFTRDFDLAEEAMAACANWDLVFAGVDTFATVWLNGIELGRTANMLIEHRFDVSRALQAGKNRVCVRIESALRMAERARYDASVQSWERREEGVRVRKAPHMWGWDIMPRAVSAGLWRPVWLEPRPANAIEQLYFWTFGLAEQDATLGVRFQVRTDRFNAGSRLRLHFRGACGNHLFEHETPLEFIAGGDRIRIPNAKRWWPKGYGDPDLYTITTRLYDAEVLLAERSDRIGIRKVEVDRTEKTGPVWAPEPAAECPARVDLDPAPDAHFVFRVNGVPILVKGANWVPLDAFHSRDAERLEAAVALFDELGCNMIRCWGGNVYEDHRFFDLCDEKGILVWQDFAFACCRYPQDAAFLDEVSAEAEAIVTKLRNHASLALWCGDNEIDGVYTWEGLNPEHNRLTREVLPQVAHRCDPYRHYVPSSPHIPDADQGRMPEQHLWGPRGYYKGRYYTHHNAHFIGEIGYHGCPNVSSIRRFIPEERLWPWRGNPDWLAHCTYHWRHDKIDRDRNKLMANQVRELFGEIPKTLERFALASQIVQAEAKKFFVESTRLRKWPTSGILWWNVIDGWPQFSDAIVDYYFGKKLAYHYIRRVQRPVCLVLGEPGSDKYLPVVLCNDSRETMPVEYRVWDAESGETAAEGRFTSQANQNWQVARIRTCASDQRLFLMEWRVNGECFGNHYLAGAPPHALARYAQLLEHIAALPDGFDAAQVAR